MITPRRVCLVLPLMVFVVGCSSGSDGLSGSAVESEFDVPTLVSQGDSTLGSLLQDQGLDSASAVTVEGGDGSMTHVAAGATNFVTHEQMQQDLVDADGAVIGGLFVNRQPGANPAYSDFDPYAVVLRDESGVVNAYLVSASANEEQEVELTSYEEDQSPSVEKSAEPDGTKICWKIDRVKGCITIK